jgi:TonB family protein
MEVFMAWRIAASLLLITLSSLTSAQEPTPQRVVGAQRMADLIMRKVEPVYPPLARAARIQGTVTLRVVINKSGDVENMQLISGHPMLAPAAMDAVRQWKYQPYLLNGEPVEVETRVTVNFTLAGTAPVEGVVGSAPGGIPSGEKGGIVSNVPVDTYPTVPGRVRVSQGVMAQLTITKVPPQYPQEAKDARIQGAVLMRVVIDKEGNISNIQLISGHPGLAPAAIEAVKQWKYRPYLLNGEPVEVDTQVQVSFTLAK